ncbi:hypothetical protein [Chenggangzhangella methanolivorans]|uniref:Uncharacterized protein n=1 Tax=Chenggangzhangella methanolivorans TaxID=1437009 RepID=A0A9E6R7N4_9HYPH|nr:hypothetical protein [Chenggangzhangella methanolivorans]QZN99518.1 hypothetical protein K6K41_22860 [Chenggangzhangella methanolivorans]
MSPRRGLREIWLFWRAHRLRERGRRIVREALARGRALRERADRYDAEAKSIAETREAEDRAAEEAAR